MGFFSGVGKRVKKWGRKAVNVGKQAYKKADAVGKQVPQKYKDQAFNYGVREAEKRTGYTREQAEGAYRQGKQAYGSAQDMKRKVEGGDYSGAAQDAQGELRRRNINAQTIRDRLRG